MRPYRIAVLGGTFDKLHPGHRRLLAAAFRAADEVRIGLTSPAYLRAHPKPYGDRIATYRDRHDALHHYLDRTYPRRRYRVVPLRDGLGGAVLPGPDLIVVSTESLPGARAVNRVRAERGLPKLAIEVVAMVRDRSGRPYASRHRRARESGVPRPPETNA